MIIRESSASRMVSSEESIDLREGLLDELAAWAEGSQDQRVYRMMNLILDGQEPTVQLFGGATITDIES